MPQYDDPTLQAWDSLSGAQDPLAPYTPPTQQEVADSSIVNAGGFKASPGDLLNLGGGILGAFGTLAAGQEGAAAYQYNAQLALQQGALEKEQLGYAEYDTLASQQAMYAKAGVEMSGSPMDVAVTTAGQYEMDKQIAQFNAESKANMDNYLAQVTKSQSEMKAGLGLLQTVGTFAMDMAMFM